MTQTQLDIEPLVCWHITPSELHALTVALADAEEVAALRAARQRQERDDLQRRYDADSDWESWHDEHEPWTATVAHLVAVARIRWRTYARTGE